MGLPFFLKIACSTRSALLQGNSTAIFVNFYRRFALLLILVLTSLFNLVVAQGLDIYEGEVRLPEGFTATGEEQITIRAVSNQFTPRIEERLVVIQVGQNSGSFAFILDSTGEFFSNWFLSLRCENCDQNISAAEHNATTTMGDPLSINDLPVAFPVGQDFRELVFTFIATGPPTQTPEPDPQSSPTLVPTIDLLLNSD